MKAILTMLQIREESISVHHNGERDYHAVYQDNTDDDDNHQNFESVVDAHANDNLQDIEPVRDKPGRG